MSAFRNTEDRSDHNPSGKIGPKISRRQFLFAGAGLAIGTEPLSTLVDELTSLLDSGELHGQPPRGESLPKDLKPLSTKTSPLMPTFRNGKIFLTFDDGPLRCTGKILDLLAATRHKATFFVIGRNLKDPKLRAFAVRALREGHDIGNHSYSHPDFSRVSAKRAEKEILSTHELIQDVIKESGVDAGRQDLFFRFPYGVSGSWANYASTQNVLASLNYHIAFWDLDTNDWRMELQWYPTSPERVLKALNRARPRDVVLLHDRQKTAHCLPQMVEALDSRHLVSAPLSDYGILKEQPAMAHQAPSEPLAADSGILHHPERVLVELSDAPFSRSTVRDGLLHDEPLTLHDSLLW